MSTPTDYERGVADGLERAIARLATLAREYDVLARAPRPAGVAERAWESAVHHYRARAEAYRESASVLHKLAHPDPQEPR